MTVDRMGIVMQRWTGYTGGYQALIKKLNQVYNESITIPKRIERYKKQPIYKDALFLAGHFSDNNEHLKAIEYYHSAVGIGRAGFYDYAFELFRNYCNAVWKDQLPTDSVFPSADAVLTSKYQSNSKIVSMGQMMVRLACKKNLRKRLGKYLKAGIDASSDEADKSIKNRKLAKLQFQADYILLIKNDTTRAIRLKKSGMKAGWQNNRDQSYAFAKYCLERRANLEEAELYARRTIDQTIPGPYRARALNTTAEICFFQGKKAEALNFIQQAIDQDPDNKFYKNQLQMFVE